MNIWLNVVKDGARETFFNTNLQQWINANLSGEIQGEGVDNWTSFWAQACHSLWFWRNKECHVDNFFRPNEPIHVIKKRVNDYLIACKVDGVIQPATRIIQQVGWLPPNDGWVVLNTDGAENSDHIFGCGGLIRGSTGIWLGGFSKGLGVCSIEVAELWGAWEGLKLAWNQGYRKVELRLDAMNVVKILNREKSVTNFSWSLCKRIWRLVELDWEVQIQHTYREGNKCADALAHMGSNLGSNVIFYESCPREIRSFVEDDAAGTSVPRLVSV
jgi:ribonuclease HI